MQVPDAVTKAVEAYEQAKIAVVEIASRTDRINDAIALVKERAASANVAGLTADLERLRTVERRFAAAMLPLCDVYAAEKTAKAATETARDQARAALDTYRETVFPAYEAAINDYLVVDGP